MHLAGVPVSPKLVVWLALMLRATGVDGDTADKLEDAVARGSTVVGLTIEDRHAILAVLDDPLDGLAELRGVLLAEHAGWVVEGL